MEGNEMPLFGRKSKKKDQALSEKEVRPLELMTQNFPKCPICGAEANYDVKGSRKIQCNSCKAQWYSNDFSGDNELTHLELTKPDKGKITMLLRGQSKSTGYWQNFDAHKYQKCSEEDIGELLRVASLTANPEDRQEVYTKLKATGDLGLSEIRGIADGIHEPKAYRILALSVLADIGDERDYGIFMRAYEDDYWGSSMGSIFVKLYKKLEMRNFGLPYMRY
jgi:hypothetical protein